MSITIEDLQKTKFQEMDDNGRLKFQGYCIGQPWCKFSRKSRDEYAHWDVSYYSGDTTIIGEIKDRQENSDTYGTWIMEINKLRALFNVRDKMKNRGIETRIHYINIFTDNELAIWDVTDLDISKLDVKTEAHQKTECGDQTKINKEVFYLPIEEALIVTR